MKELSVISWEGGVILWAVKLLKKLVSLLLDAYRHPPYQGGQGGSNLKSIFHLIITSYLFA